VCVCVCVVFINKFFLETPSKQEPKANTPEVRGNSGVGFTSPLETRLKPASAKQAEISPPPAPNFNLALTPTPSSIVTTLLVKPVPEIVTHTSAIPTATPTASDLLANPTAKATTPVNLLAPTATITKSTHPASPQASQRAYPTTPVTPATNHDFTLFDTTNKPINVDKPFYLKNPQAHTNYVVTPQMVKELVIGRTDKNDSRVNHFLNMIWR